jgi:hypothetical protein
MSFQAINRDDVREAFRLRLLEALDSAAQSLTGEPDCGWTDSDLPHLFRALDAQIERWAERKDVALLEPQD